MTEFIGIALALRYLGLPEKAGVVLSAVLIAGSVCTGSFRRFERLALILVFGSLALIPFYFLGWPPAGEVARHLAVPELPNGGLTSDAMLLIIGIVGTTVAPWQLFFQQSYVIDKRITPRFIRYERMDLGIGIALVMIGAIAIMAVAAHAFVGRPEFGNFTDVGGTALGVEHAFGRFAGVLFAAALIVSAMLGAAAVSLSTAYALGDVLALKHSLHRKPWEALGFYLLYGLLIVGAAALVLTPGVPLGLITTAVQALAGVLLPSATVFLLLLCNDRAVLGPWVNGRWLNLLASVIVAVLVLLSLILTASVMFPGVSEHVVAAILIVGSLLAVATAIAVSLAKRTDPAPAVEPMRRQQWRMPPLQSLTPLRLTPLTRLWMVALHGYLLVAAALVLLRIGMLALGS